jgi:GNAT superfamily N-acetyltransferase
MTHADLQLARRIEAAEAVNARECNVPGGATLEIGGGLAVFAGAESPLTHAVGIGLHGPVSAAQIEQLEQFFRSRGAWRTAIDLCPLADPSVAEALGDRGYRAAEFNNVLVKPLNSFSASPTPTVRRALETECELWSRTVGQGFFEQEDLTEEEMDVGRAIFSMPGSFCYFATANEEETAGCGALSIHSGLATLFADSVVGRYRRRGLHQALISARLSEAHSLGCDLAAASTAPGSTSQRNFEGMGFQVVYTKVMLVR